MKKVRVDPQDKLHDVITDWRTGEFTQRELADKYGVSSGFVAKHTKGVPKDLAGTVSKLVEAKQDLAELDAQTVSNVLTVVEEKSRHLIYLNRVAVQNVQEAMDAGCGTQSDYFSRAGTILRAKEVVAGKAPDTAVQVNVNGPVEHLVTLCRASQPMAIPQEEP